MYQKAYGLIETLAPLHVGATAGEESGNLNLIFRDQFTRTGIVPGSSIRGRFRSEMYHADANETNYWYGHESVTGQENSTTESLVKFEYASIVWLPVFCPGQPIVWVSCPRLLKRYKRIAGVEGAVPDPYTGSSNLQGRESGGQRTLFFNLGFLTIHKVQDFTGWFPDGIQQPAVVVDDSDIGMIHDMALYRQSRVALNKEEKKVSEGAFFNTEALPEGTLMVFPIALRKEDKGATWNPFDDGKEAELYLGGLESIGFGHCRITLRGI
ncbi:RAMP superfamily CRISPR-associated protein [Anthocerotibacter panamensis]|uniref:RAMP superfamily CRISPR-associated protein n=1 Tax=Anthocerotibacter panamensis TaxID=2857077 RepID=UPI001C4087AE|nr:RAMP superfamily CRISPR-associated protein [Anthocerotibacter panamensis]